jgi:hypothetical protein
MTSSRPTHGMSTAKGYRRDTPTYSGIGGFTDVPASR